ncbi:MAG TPA: hypothetical protein VKX28_29265 [Xanthobacteraceae bacterium]|jgi:hypothetical protein|nr:hypothetical protein [Xanthobacteraceae bacterium]
MTADANDLRTAIGEAFLAAFLADWQDARNGRDAIAAMRTEKPTDYVKLAAALAPKEFREDPIDELTDAELAARIAQLAADQAAAPQAGTGAAGDAEAT